MFAGGSLRVPAFGPAALRRRLCVPLVVAAVVALALPPLLLRSSGDGVDGNALPAADGDGGDGGCICARVVRRPLVAAAVGPNVNASSVSYVHFADPLAGLGNKMFQYASGLGMALRYGKRAVLVADHPVVDTMLDGLAATFTLSELARVPYAPPLAVSVVAEAGWGKYDARVFDDDAAAVLGSGAFVITGHLQSWRYFHQVSEAIRREFRLTSPYERAAATFMRRQRLPRRSVIVGVHVRRGDMLRRPDLYTTAPASYLRKAVDYYLAKYGGSRNVSFVVATDDREWVEWAAASSLPPRLTLRYTGLTAELDMAVLSKCDHAIITGGTFGWWAAWLAGGDVVYYSDFISPTSRLYPTYNATDYYPPHWVGMT